MPAWSLEAETVEGPKDHFLHKAQQICHENGALFVLDEIITGFRLHRGGAQPLHDIVPDLSTFGKALGNGFSISALVGKREVMQLGGFQHTGERVFLLSQTHGAANHALAAAIATMKVYEANDVVGFLYRQGERLVTGINKAISRHHLEGHFEVIGKPCNLIYVTKDQQGNRSQNPARCSCRKLSSTGILGPSFVVSYSHQDEDIDRTIDAVADALVVYRKALDEGVGKYLVGRPVKPVFRKFN